MKGSASVVVNKPIEEVFAFVENIENMDQWVDGVESPKWVEQGKTFTSIYTYGGGTHTLNYQVTALQAPHLFATQSTEGPFAYKGQMELEDTPEGTKITNTLEVGEDGFFTKMMFTLFAPFMRRMMAKQIRKELDQLKQKIEI